MTEMSRKQGHLHHFASLYVMPGPDRASPTGITQKSREKTQKSREKILLLLQAHPEYSAKRLSEEIGVTEKAIEKQLAKLKADGRIKRNGPDKGGSWEVIM